MVDTFTWKAGDTGWAFVLDAEEFLIVSEEGKKKISLVRFESLDDVHVIAENAKTNTSLEGLCLWGFNNNEIGPHGAHILFRALEENMSLVDLSLGGHQMGDEGLYHLCQILYDNSTLVYLSVWGNGITARGASFLSEVLERNSTLTHLNIGQNKLDDQGVQNLLDGWRKNSTLRSLCLDKNQIGCAGALYIAEEIKNNSTLQYVDLSPLPPRSEPVEPVEEKREIGHN